MSLEDFLWWCVQLFSWTLETCWSFAPLRFFLAFSLFLVVLALVRMLWAGAKK